MQNVMKRKSYDQDTQKIEKNFRSFFIIRAI